jgi:hypothetical protein
MRLTALTVGSRGDTKPYLALAGLQRAGHQVTLATHRPIEPDARRLGLGFAPTEGNPRQILRPSRGAWLEAYRICGMSSANGVTSIT